WLGPAFVELWVGEDLLGPAVVHGVGRPAGAGEGGDQARGGQESAGVPHGAPPSMKTVGGGARRAGLDERFREKVGLAPASAPRRGPSSPRPRSPRCTASWRAAAPAR